MTDIIIKKAEIKDIPALLAIENKSTGLKTFSAMTTEKEWLSELSNENVTIYLILKDNAVVGDTSYEKMPDGSFHVTGLVIEPQYQKQGIGRQAMKMILDELKDAKRIELVTHPENAPAIKIYTSFGFKIKERIENYFGDGEPRIRLVKENN
jgi:ribosomal protein S18 acetylase RimI-like enzyme